MPHAFLVQNCRGGNIRQPDDRTRCRRYCHSADNNIESAFCQMQHHLHRRCHIESYISRSATQRRRPCWAQGRGWDVQILSSRRYHFGANREYSWIISIWNHAVNIQCIYLLYTRTLSISVTTKRTALLSIEHSRKWAGCCGGHGRRIWFAWCSNGAG